MLDIPKSIRCAVETASMIEALPAMPTQDWVRRCAAALVHIGNAPDARNSDRTGEKTIVLSLVCTLGAHNDSISVVTAGVAINGLPDGGEPNSTVIAIQDRAERLTRLGFAIPESALKVGLIAPLSLIDPNWSNSPMRHVLGAKHATHPLVYAIPIKGGHADLWLINFIGNEPGVQHESVQMRLHMLSALHRPLMVRASDALRKVNNPRAWLTERELAVLTELIEGQSVRVIAEKIDRSAHTVHDHVKSLHKKLGASSRGELIAKALGYTHRVDPADIADPVLMLLSPDQFAELKPPQLTARPIRS